MSIERAKQVIRHESQAISRLESRVGENFMQALSLLEKCRGHVVVTGVGKSGIVARKLSATLSSTGTPAVFLNALEAAHGDIGLLRASDVVIIISRSGTTDELQYILQYIKLLAIHVIGILGNIKSYLADKCDIVLDASVEAEACPFNLAPTTSSTAALVMGDALAIALLERKGFTEDDFKFLHPGGTLGRRLRRTIFDLMHSGGELPLVNESTPINKVIIEMTSKMLGVTCVVNEQGRLTGIITDGDLRRLLEKSTKLNGVAAVDFMSRDPKTVSGDALAAKGVNLMERFSITHLVVVDKDSKPQGIVHLHDLLRAGIW
ncbi:KpsF/GutQ family sugar-phosphate isomerase [bacterium]|nr:KpsF/GutQ family sugar-phosphate isomerase [FCB group bacterium]MBL7191088.1 KpsF/GutQ family sugar-phosphate isomerase [bacterium]